jgi:ribokinase
MNEGFCVAGSINVDLIARSPRFPLPGETITGSSFALLPGGKGANQAVALARLGGSVEIIGSIGDDALGRQYGEAFSAAGVGYSGVSVLPGISTGTASITVTDSGENEIIVVPGANGRVSPDYIRKNAVLIEGSAFLLLQLEIPLESVLEAALIADRSGTHVILDPAPARPLPDALFRLVDVLTPNETEAKILTGEDTADEAGIRRAGEALLARGIRTVIVKAGARGAYLVEKGMFCRVEGFAVRAIDTVAAGDSFNAGLAFALSLGYEITKAIRFANAVGAISTTKEGAQSAMPTRAELDVFLAESGHAL